MLTEEEATRLVDDVIGACRASVLAHVRAALSGRGFHAASRTKESLKETRDRVIMAMLRRSAAEDDEDQDIVVPRTRILARCHEMAG